MLLPAYLFKAGLGSKLSTWLTPPQRNIQITDLALAGKCGLPSGEAAVDSARARPSRKSMALKAKPVNPMPVSIKNDRRVTPGQQLDFDVAISSSWRTV